MALTVVSAIVKDSDGQNWFRGTWKLEFVPNPSNPVVTQYIVDGTAHLNPAIILQTGNMDSNGYFSISLYDNTSITPIGSSWKLTVCPLSSASCGFYVFSAAGASLDISGALTFLLPAPRFLGVYPNYGYADGEVIISNKPGSTYYNVTIEAQKYYNDVTQTWAIVGTGPAGSPGTPGAPGPPGTPSATPPTIITGIGTDLNTLTTSGVYYIEQGTGANTPSNAQNSDMAILEVFAHMSPTYQGPYILQRLWLSQDSWSGAAPGRWYMRWYWDNSGTQAWTPWYYHLPTGSV